MAIEWQKSFETGIAEIDQDHRCLVDLIKKLDRMLEQNSDLGQVGAVIDELTDYADYHFKREEVMFAGAGYDGADDHAKVHDQFGEYLGGLVANCMMAQTHETARQLHDYLQGWLADHILVEDQKFAQFLRGR